MSAMRHAIVMLPMLILAATGLRAADPKPAGDTLAQDIQQIKDSFATKPLMHRVSVESATPNNPSIKLKGLVVNDAARQAAETTAKGLTTRAVTNEVRVMVTYQCPYQVKFPTRITSHGITSMPDAVLTPFDGPGLNASFQKARFRGPTTLACHVRHTDPNDRKTYPAVITRELAGKRNCGPVYKDKFVQASDAPGETECSLEANTVPGAATMPPGCAIGCEN